MTLKLIDNPNKLLLETIACPISKEPLEFEEDKLVSPCGFTYPDGDLRVGLEFSNKWEESQNDFAKWQKKFFANNEKKNNYYQEVDESLANVYRNIRLEGRVLDVGGGIGTAAQQAKISAENYISVDAMPFLWHSFEKYSNLTSHYKHCKSLCRIPGFGEFLPFRTSTMDSVHMRSCLDHFANPLLALMEAYRVLQPNGKIVIGISLEGAYKKNNKIFSDKAKAFIKKNTITRLIYESLFDHHHFHPTENSIESLLKKAGFIATKKHWEETCHNVLYLEAKKLKKVI